MAKQFDMNQAERDSKHLTVGPRIGDYKTVGDKKFVYTKEGWQRVYASTAEKCYELINQIADHLGVKLDENKGAEQCQ